MMENKKASTFARLCTYQVPILSDRIKLKKKAALVRTALKWAQKDLNLRPLLAKKSLSGFLRHQRRSEEKLMFIRVDPDWLENYELYMVHSGRSKTTV
jgi:hypothetical protein